MTATAPAPAQARSLEALGDEIVSLAGRVAAAMCRWLLLVAEFDARDGCVPSGVATTAHWLSWRCSLSMRTARDHVRVAQALTAHPLLVDEMSAGRLSYSHVRAISRVARPGESMLVADLVHLAKHGTVAQLESAVRGLRTVRDADVPEWSADERLTTGWADDSRWRMSARLAPEDGAVVDSAIRAYARARGVSLPQALILLAEAGLAALNDENMRTELRGDERAAVVVHLDAERFDARSAADGTGTASDGSAEPAALPAARVADGPGLPDAVLRRLACSGKVRTIVSRRSIGQWQPLDVGRTHRLVTPKQMIALRVRDRGCAHPGCGSNTNLEAHHVEHWLDGGRTNMDNLVLLCRRHHHQHHDDEFTIDALGGGRFRFVRNGRPMLARRPDAASQCDVEQEHADVLPDAPASRWDGRRLDVDWTVSGLAQHLTAVA